MLHPHLTADDRNAMRFQREGKAISKLDHPHIVKIHDFGFAASGQPYMVMDLLEGNSLSHLIAENGYLTVHTALSIFEQICSALAHAHEQGILHRDLKPSNIIVLQNKYGTAAKLVDFGIAKIMEREGEESNQVTQTGEIFGSPYYMSPEQCKGNRLDERSDIYSLGCILFECLTGRPPHQASSAFETMIKHINEKAPLPSEARPDLQFPARVDALLSKLLAVDTRQRYRSVNAVLTDLEALKKAAAEPQKLPVGGNKRKRLILSLGAVTLVAASLLAVSLGPIFSTRKQAPKPPPSAPVQSSLPAPTKPQPVEDNTDAGVPADVVRMLDTHTEIDLHKRKGLNNSWIKEIARHKNISSLNLSDHAITDSGVAELAGMPVLDTLRLSNTRITSKSMATVAALPALTVFDARDSNIDDDGAMVLGRSKSLEHLLLPNAHLTSEGLKYLGKMESLQELDVWKNHVGDRGIAYLKNPNLDNLSVGTTYITDRAATPLSKLTTLRTLYLSNNEIGDSAWQRLLN